MILYRGYVVVKPETIRNVQKQSKNNKLDGEKMLTEERYSIILEQVRKYKSVKLPELCELLGASESTVRRDLISLDDRELIKKYTVEQYR